MVMDKLIHGTAADGTIRCMSAITTKTVSEAVRRHQTSPIVADAFGRVLTGTLLLGSSLKEFDRLTVKIECDGEVKGIVAETTAQGNVRGYVKNPIADGSSVSEIVGGGMFHVIRESGFEIGLFRDPYHGSVSLYTGKIAEDFAYYLMKSEQIPSAVMLGVALQNHEPYVAAAGGVMLQVMPEAKDHIITMIEDTLSYAPNITQAVREGATPKDLLELTLGIIDFEVLSEREVNFSCNCSMERAVAMISMLGKDEVESILKEDEKSVITCGFCNETYLVDKTKLEEILSTL
jgi:molecular chaperone Hsp33